MFNKRGVIHESVAAALGDMGIVTEGQQTDPSNNQRFVTEGAMGIAGLVAEGEKPDFLKKKEDKDGGDCDDKDKKDGDDKEKDDKTVSEAAKHVPDETDGEPDTATNNAGTTANPKVDTDPKNTGPTVDVDPGKTKKGQVSEEELAAADEAATAFYESVNKPVTFVIYEGEGDEPEHIEVHGLTTEDVAPFGGTAPAMPAKMMKQAKDGGSNKKGDTGVLMLYSTKGMDERTKKMLTGQNFRACGWGTPPKGAGMKAG